jgi:hypothetical protein
MYERVVAKKTGAVERFHASDHAGLLVNGPPGYPGLPFI